MMICEHIWRRFGNYPNEDVYPVLFNAGLVECKEMKGAEFNEIRKVSPIYPDSVYKGKNFGLPDFPSFDTIVEIKTP